LNLDIDEDFEDGDELSEFEDDENLLSMEEFKYQQTYQPTRWIVVPLVQSFSLDF